MIRGVGLRSAVAINVATMVGAGPFITLPLVVAALHGSVSAVAWIVGALIALCDGLVWAELASRYPRSGGTYTYLREAFGPRGPGRFVAFLFVWQFLFWAPLILASGYIGFAQYAAYLFPALAAPVPTHLVAVAVGVVTLIALYRAIPQIARTALVLGAVALVTLLVVALAGLTHPYAPLGQTIPATFGFPPGLGVSGALVALGAALVITLYDYGGYGDVCALGDEVVAPVRTIPLAVVLSVILVGVAYVLLNLGVAAALPAKEIAASTAIAALVAERAFGAPFAIAVTIAVLITAFGSTYGLLLGASRIPYAAAREGDFLAPFARLHPSGKFPAVSLIAIGLLALPASLFPLDLVINALTAGIVLVQGAGQVFALILARRSGPAPFRIPLYPLPPLLALAGWVFLFVSTGLAPIAFGLGTLFAGALVFLIRARVTRAWPFAAALTALLLALGRFAVPANAAPAPPSFGHAAIVHDAAGEPVLRVDGKPFFFLGGAFFYERIPRSEWRGWMTAMRAMGANTLDLYVPWNWHELADGDFDFTGRTSPRRDLREVLRLGKELGFYFIVRPGPVIRNEWRNGGYPQWLLERPEYGMPLHDVLEGRYPATATLQNKQSDAAAAEWLANATHKRYAARWLHRALNQLRPVADRVIAVQLDDDQAAYLDNDTYPGPHLHAYLHWLESQARDVVGPVTPTFVNTFESKVPAALPEWAMGNWYQSDAYSIGEHDRAELAFATATLRTQNRGPLAYSEFQAGWLAGPGDPTPRMADPTNTSLAIGELTGWGITGLIDFPLQDTLAPFGWEAPFSNAFYAWSAAFALDGHPWPRAAPTEEQFAQLAFYGPALAEARRVATVALPYDGRHDSFGAAARLKTWLAACRARRTTCDAIDPMLVGDRRLASFPTLLVPHGEYATLRARALRLGVHVVESFGNAGRSSDGTAMTTLRGPHGTFIVAENWSATRRTFQVDRLANGGRPVSPFVLAPRSTRIVAVNVDLPFLSREFARGDRLTTSCRIGWAIFGPRTVTLYDGSPFDDPGAVCGVDAVLHGARLHQRLRGPATLALRVGAKVGYMGFGMTTYIREVGIRLARSIDAIVETPPHLRPGLTGPHAYRADVFQDGDPEIVLQNDRVLALLSPDGGARAISFGSREPSLLRPHEILRNIFDATGGLRDDVLVQPPPSTTDRIARYTHLFPAGTFNRTYGGCTFEGPRGAGAYLTYDAPDVVPSGARFERVVTLGRSSGRLIVDERFTPHGAGGEDQRLISLSALSTFDPEYDAAMQPIVTAGSATTPLNQAVAIDPRYGGLTISARHFASYDSPSAVSVAWLPGDVESASWTPAKSNGTLRLVLAPGGWRRVTYALLRDASAAAPRAFGEAERAWVAANRPPSGENGEVAKWYTQSPQKRPSESSCGFESHLPQ